MTSETSDSSVPEPSDAPDAPDAPDIPGESDAPDAPDIPGAQGELDTLGESDAPGAQGELDTPGESDAPDAPDIPGAQGEPDTLGESDAPGAQGEPDTPGESDAADAPDAPDIPGAQGELDTLGESDAPDAQGELDTPGTASAGAGRVPTEPMRAAEQDGNDSESLPSQESLSSRKPAPQGTHPQEHPVRETAQLEPLPLDSPPAEQSPPQKPSAQTVPERVVSWPDPLPLDSIAPGPPSRLPGTRGHSLGRSRETVYHTSAVYGGGRHAQPPKRRPVAVMVVGGVVVAVVAALVLMLTVFKSGSSTPKYGMVPNGSSAQADAGQVATAFLTAWQAGDLAQAANYTDQPTAAQAGLAAYAKDLNLGKFVATAGAVANAAGSTASQPRETVTFAVSASVATGSGKGALRGTWAYHSKLVAYQQAKSSVWFVAWRPDVVAPNLTSATHLAAVQVPPTVSMVTDASGRNLKRYGDPGLDTIAGLLAASPPASGGAKPGLDVQIVTKTGKPVANSQAPLIAPGNYPTLSTTINAKAETAARASVATHKGSSMVVIQPSTGQILAIANNAGFNDFALTAAVAPGSTMKIITSTALLNSGLATADTPVACPPVVVVQGIKYHNDAGESEPASTPLYYDFAQSCNNAFSQWWPHLYGKLASTAKDYYGLNQNWDIGIGNLSASYFNAPANASGSELAEEAFGEGKLQASPLAMASVAATVDSGRFKQPILTTTARQVTAKPLPPATVAGLKKMMRAVVTSGTAAGLGFGPHVYAKTGTADVVGQDQPNSWLVAFDPTKDVAVACLVVGAGYGAQIAGPEVAAFLNAY